MTHNRELVKFWSPGKIIYVYRDFGKSSYLEKGNVDERRVVVDELEAEELHGVAVLEVRPRPRRLHVGKPQRHVTVDLNKEEQD